MTAKDLENTLSMLISESLGLQPIDAIAQLLGELMNKNSIYTVYENLGS